MATSTNPNGSDHWFFSFVFSQALPFSVLSVISVVNRISG